jgi:hypothetical protein
MNNFKTAKELLKDEMVVKLNLRIEKLTDYKSFADAISIADKNMCSSSWGDKEFRDFVKEELSKL